MLVLVPLASAGAQTFPTSTVGDINNPRAVSDFEARELRRSVERGSQQGRVGAETAPAQQDVPAPPGAEGITFKLNEIVFSESKVFSQEELDGFVAPYVGNTIAVSDLFKITAIVNQEYRKRGYLTTQAILVPQEIVGGKVEIKLVEGTIGNITVSNNERVRSAFVVSRVQVEPGSIPTVRLLERRVSAVNWNRNFQVAVGLEPGKAPGTTDLELDVSGEPKKVSGVVYLDNHGAEDSGLYNLGVISSFYSLFGYDEMFTVGLTTSTTDYDTFLQNSDVGSYFFDAQLPLPVGNGSFRGLISHSDSAVLEGEFEPLGIDGRGDFGSVSLSQPIYSTPRFNFSVIGGAQLSDTLSAVGIVNTETRSHRLFGALKGQASFAAQGTYLEGELRFIQSWVDLAGLSGPEHETVTRVVGEATLFQNFGHAVSLLSRAAGQYTPEHRLPSGERWYMGGVWSLPAYELSSISGDTGFYLANQIRYAPPSLGEAIGKALNTSFGAGVKAFFDVGAAFDDIQTLEDSDYYADVGLGADFQIADHLNGDFLLAWPVDPGNNPNLQIENPRFLFTLKATF